MKQQPSKTESKDPEPVVPEELEETTHDRMPDAPSFLALPSPEHALADNRVASMLSHLGGFLSAIGQIMGQEPAQMAPTPTQEEKRKTAKEALVKELEEFEKEVENNDKIPDLKKDLFTKALNRAIGALEVCCYEGLEKAAKYYLVRAETFLRTGPKSSPATPAAAFDTWCRIYDLRWWCYLIYLKAKQDKDKAEGKKAKPFEVTYDDKKKMLKVTIGSETRYVGPRKGVHPNKILIAPYVAKDLQDLLNACNYPDKAFFDDLQKLSEEK